jgi:hypothetical protein
MVAEISQLGFISTTGGGAEAVETVLDHGMERSAHVHQDAVTASRGIDQWPPPNSAAYDEAASRM